MGAIMAAYRDLRRTWWGMRRKMVPGGRRAGGRGATRTHPQVRSSVGETLKPSAAAFNQLDLSLPWPSHSTSYRVATSLAAINDAVADRVHWGLTGGTLLAQAAVDCKHSLRERRRARGVANRHPPFSQHGLGHSSHWPSFFQSQLRGSRPAAAGSSTSYPFVGCCNVTRLQHLANQLAG